MRRPKGSRHGRTLEETGWPKVTHRSRGSSALSPRPERRSSCLRRVFGCCSPSCACARGVLGAEVALLRVDQLGWDGFLCNIGAAVIGDGGDIIELPGSIDGSVAVTGLGAVIPSIPCSPSDEPSPHATTRLELMISTSTRVLMRNPPSSVTGLLS